MHRQALSLALVGIAACGFPSAAAAQAKSLNEFGIVLMHGKGGSPEGLIAPLAAALKSSGALVIAPSMPWQGSKGRPRGYTETYDQAMQKIDHAVAELKSRGAKRIAIAGQSFGGNAALGYAARRGQDLAAVIVVSPGHTPDLQKATAIRDAVAKAKELVASGRGDAAIKFPDFNQGERIEVLAKPAAYLSFFDPDGAAVMPRSAAAMPSLPFLWVIGRSDPLHRLGEAYVYARAPKHAKSKYVVVNAGHRDTPDVARQDIIAWLRTL